MYETLRQFITALGGYRAVARRLQMGSTTLHGYITSGLMPAKWYGAMLALAAEAGLEPPMRSLFSFEALPPQNFDEKDAA